MATKAFVLIEAEAGKGHEVVATLKGIEGVTAADPVTGPYDVIAVVEGQRFDEIDNIVTGKIQTIPGVSQIAFCLVSEDLVAVPIQGSVPTDKYKEEKTKGYLLIPKEYLERAQGACSNKDT